MTDEWTPVTPEVERLWSEYEAVYRAKGHFTKMEKDLKAQLCEKLGYDPDDPKPQPFNACTESGEPLFKVNIGSSTRPDVTYLKTTYPEIYAECEKTSPSKSFRSA